MPNIGDQKDDRRSSGGPNCQANADRSLTTPLHARRILVTGASGFIGSNLARWLAESGHDVTCLLRPTSSDRALEGVPASLVRGQLSDYESMIAAVRGTEVVFHAAGCLWTPRFSDFYRVNREGTRSLLRACSQTDRPPVVVFVSSIAAAGASPPDRPRVESDPPTPVSHYGRSKLAAELIAREFAHAVPVTVVRPPIVLGEGDRSGLAMFKAIARFGRHFVPGRKPQRYSIVHVRDLTEALALAAERGARIAPCGTPTAETDGRGIYFLADDEAPTYADLGTVIGQALGRKKTRIVRMPMPLVRAAPIEALRLLG